MNLGTRTCVRCGVLYEPTGMTQKYCPECRIVVNKENGKKGRAKYLAKVKIALEEYEKKNGKGE